MTREDPSAFAPPPAFGPFRVLHQIGVGALGPVFRTYEPTRDRLIAVKVFRLDITPEQAQLLADELSHGADAGLFHPSIVEPVAAGLEGTVAYRAEEYVAAETLDVAIRHHAPAPLEKVLPFITQLAGAIDFARAAGIGHGALHLRDIFVTPDEARASGFGVVEALERVGLRAPVRRPYSAPERIAGEAWGTPADVYSLAAICYELLTARRPAGSGEQVGPLSEAEGGAHAGMTRAVLARAMDEDPGTRFPSALAFASALEAAGRGEHVSGAVGRVAAIAAAAPASALGAGEEASGAADDPDAIDDIAVERDDDQVHYGLAERERDLREAEEAEGGASSALYDDEGEAAEDLALAPPPARYSDFDGPDADPAPVTWPDDPDAIDVIHPDDRLHAAAVASLLEDGAEPEPVDEFMDEPAVELIDESADDPMAPAPRREELQAGFAYDDDSAAPMDRERGAASGRAAPLYVPPREPTREDEYRGPTAVGPPGADMLPRAVMLLIGLLIGFAVGYAVRGPASLADAADGQTASEPATAEPPAQAAEIVPSDTEQRLTQPTAPPDIPDEVPAPESAPAVAATGSLVINSTPAKANVTINGQWRGRTPLTLEDQPFGTYDVRVVQDGLAVATERVVLSASSPARTLSVRLQRPTPPARPAPAPPGTPPTSQKPAVYVGSMYVDSRPRGARVIVNGTNVGTTPLRLADLPIGSHVVRLELDDHQVWTTSATVQAGQEARVTGSLDRIR